MRKYQSPLMRNIGGSNLFGNDEPMGVCYSGGQPYTQCVVGPAVSGGACSTGSFVVEDPQCKVGSNALTGCKTGSVA